MKICIFGSPSTGKSALCQQFFYKKFISNAETTMEENYVMQYMVQSHPITIELYDPVVEKNDQDEYVAPPDRYVEHVLLHLV